MPATSITLDFTLRQAGFTLELRETVAARTVALFGASGAGKTTTLDAIAGLRRPRDGVIRVGARALFDARGGVDLPAHERRVGYVPQDVALFPHLDVEHNVRYGARSTGASAQTVLGLLEIDTLRARRVDALSGGERQRVALARALMSARAGRARYADDLRLARGGGGPAHRRVGRRAGARPRVARRTAGSRADVSGARAAS